MTNAFGVIKGFFEKNKNGIGNHHSMELDQMHSASKKEYEGNGDHFSIISAGWGTSVGKQRENNQDSLMLFSTEIISNNSRQTIAVYAVADGMGGHRNGEIASKTAVETVQEELVQKNLDKLSSIEMDNGTEYFEGLLKSCTFSAHNRVREEIPGGGTTLTIALIVQDQVVIAHTGDSRAYFVSRDGDMQLLTRDHSIVSRMQEMGQLTDEQAASHPQKNILYRALGQLEYKEPDLYSYPIPHSGFLLLCSDGLWGLILEDQISSIITESDTPQTASENLVDAANRAGGHDNISVIVVRFPGEPN